VMHTLYRSEMHYVGDAEETIPAHLQSGGSILISPYHQSLADTPTLAGIGCEKPFITLKGTTNIPAKAEMFGWPLVGRFVPHMRAHPTFRGADFAPDDAGQALRKEVGHAVVALNIDNIDAGGNDAMFGRGTRDKTRSGQAGPLRKGIGRISTGVKNPENLLVVTAGIAYRWYHLRLRPLVVINEPFCPAGMTVEEVVEEAEIRTQEATDLAFLFAGQAKRLVKP